MDIELKTQWRRLCNQYLQEFVEKHEITLEPYPWVADNPGTVAMLGDYFVSMENIRYDIDNNIPVGWFEEWYDKHTEYTSLELKYMNFETYCKKCPDPYTPEQIEKIREGKRKIDELKAEMIQSIKDANDDYDKKMSEYGEKEVKTTAVAPNPCHF